MPGHGDSATSNWRCLRKLTTAVGGWISTSELTNLNCVKAGLLGCQVHLEPTPAGAHPVPFSPHSNIRGSLDNRGVHVANGDTGPAAKDGQPEEEALPVHGCCM